MFRLVSSVLGIVLATAITAGPVAAQLRGDGYEVWRDERYSQTAKDPRRNCLDLYLPKLEDDATAPPLVMFVHGGSWIAGGKGRHRGLGERLAQNQIAVAAINYRLAPVAEFPAHLEDCAAAFCWLRDRADRFGYDPRRIVLMGHSAGGHLCALLALDRRAQERFGIAPATIHGVVGLSGVYDVRPEHRLLATVFGADADGRTAASPIVHAHEHAPPFFLRWGSRDIDGLPASAMALTNRLQALDVPVDALELRGEGHTGYAYRVARESCAIGEPLLEFLQRPRPEVR